MVSLHAGRFVVVHLYSSFSVDPQNFPLGANLYQKLPFFAILGAVNPHFKATTMKFGMKVRTWDFLPQAKFCKNCKFYWANLYQKIPILAISGAVGPHFKATTVKFGMRMRAWNSLPHTKFCIKIA